MSATDNESIKLSTTVYDKLAASLNISVLPINEAKVFVEYWLKNSDFTKARTPHLGLIGESGVGKTACVKQVACKDNGYHLIVLRMSNMDEGEINGYPAPTDQGTIKLSMVEHYQEQVEYAVQNDLQLVILFDELNRAKPSMIKTVFNVIDEGWWAGYKLPPNTAFIVATNPATDIHQVSDIWGEEAALNSRFALIGVKASLGSFLQYVREQVPDFNAGLLMYIEENPACLADFKNMYEGRKYTCPAVLEAISRYINVEIAAGMHIEKIRNVQYIGIRSMIEATAGTPFKDDLVDYLHNIHKHIKSTIILDAYDTIRPLVLRTVKKAAALRNQENPRGEYDPIGSLNIDVSYVNVLASKLGEQMGSMGTPIERGKRNKNLANFLSDIPTESLATWIDAIDSSAKSSQTDGTTYIREVTGHLLGHPAYVAAMEKAIVFNKEALDY